MIRSPGCDIRCTFVYPTMRDASKASKREVTAVVEQPQDEIPQATMDHYKEAFASYDEGGKGTLSGNDVVRNALADCGIQLTLQEFVDEVLPLLPAGLLHTATGSGKKEVKGVSMKQFADIAVKAQPIAAAKADANNGFVLGVPLTRRATRKASRHDVIVRDQRSETAKVLEKLHDLREHLADGISALVQESVVKAATVASHDAGLSAGDPNGLDSTTNTDRNSQTQTAEQREEVLVQDCLAQLELMGVAMPPDELLQPVPLDSTATSSSLAISGTALATHLDALCAKFSAALAEQMEWVEAFSADDLLVSAEALAAGRKVEAPKSFNAAQHAQDLIELEDFQFVGGSAEPSARKQGSAAFRQRVKDFPYFMFPIDSVCSRLDALDELWEEYEKALRGKEFLLIPKCIDGRLCRLQDVPEHRLAFTHPCFSEEVPCPHRHRRLHMKCYSHVEDDNPDYEVKLKALQRRMGVVELTGMELGDAGAQCLAFVLHQDKHRDVKPLYQELHMSANHISPDGGVPLLEACQHLVHLDLSGNALGYKTVALIQGSAIGPALQTLLTKAEHLVSLNLSRNRLSDRDGRYIAEGLKTNTALKHLDLRKNDLGAKFGDDMASAISENRDLRELLLGWNRLESAGSAALLLEMKTSSTLELVDLSWTGISDEGAKAVAEMIAGSVALRVLSVAHNNIGPEGASSISNALKANKTLQSLDLGFNPIGTKAASELVKELKDNITLETIDLRCVKAGDEVAEEIKRLLKTREPKMQQQGLKMAVLFSTSLVGGGPQRRH